MPDWGDWSLNNEGVDMDSLTNLPLSINDHRLSADGDECEAADLGEDRRLLSAWDACASESGEDAEEEATVPQLNYNPSKAKKGLVECEYCGRYGVKDAFYSKSKRFCSRACAGSFSKLASSHPSVISTAQPELDDLSVLSDFKSKQPSEVQKANKTFIWNDYLSPSTVQAAPVHCFKHCPMWSCWEHICIGLKLEVVNCHAGLANHATVYWVAAIIRLEGYRALMRYEGFGQDSAHDFWLNLCSCDVHPVGWCAANGKPLVPPKVIQNKYTDWREVLVRRLTGAHTLPHDFSDRVSTELTSWPLVPRMQLEVVDKMCVSAMRVAAVQETVCGRVKLQYLKDIPTYDNDTFWCHSHSMLIHPVGWCRLVGHKLHASPEYKKSSLEKAIAENYCQLDATPAMFPKLNKVPSVNEDKFQVGMKLEAIDPLNLSAICVATVMKVLRHDYLMIGIDGSMAANGSDWFCYHASSSSIFPVGFCKINNIDLTPPRGYKGPFRWLNYLRETKSIAAPVHLFHKEMPNHGFKPGMKLETVDLMEPRLICVSTVARIVGRLLCIHFDGWDDSYNQWVDCSSPDIYPVGWCEMVGYHLEGPRSTDAVTTLPANGVKKRRYKAQVFKGARRKRRRGGHNSSEMRQSLPMMADSDLSQDGLPNSAPPTSSTHSTYQISFSGDVASQVPSSAIMPVLSPSNQSVTPPTTGQALPTTIQAPPTTVQAPPSAGLANHKMKKQEQEFSGVQQTSSGTLSTSSASLSCLANSLPSITSMLNSPVTNDVKQLVSPSKSSSATSAGLEPLTSSTSPLLGVSRITTHNTPQIDEKTKPNQIIMPHKWSVFDVCQFLRINDCASHCDAFRKKGIDGPKFLSLSKEMIVSLTGMKVGPSLKIYDLIQALKIRLVQQQQQQQLHQLQSKVDSDVSSKQANTD